MRQTPQPHRNNLSLLPIRLCFSRPNSAIVRLIGKKLHHNYPICFSRVLFAQTTAFLTNESFSFLYNGIISFSNSFLFLNVGPVLIKDTRAALLTQLFGECVIPINSSFAFTLSSKIGARTSVEKVSQTAQSFIYDSSQPSPMPQ